MILLVSEFQTYGIPEDRLTYFEISQDIQECFDSFRPTVKTAGQAIERIWYENDPVLKGSEIECFMTYVVMLKLYVSHHHPDKELRNEVKRMVSEGILQKYQTLLPADEYQLLASDVKALQLDS